QLAQQRNRCTHAVELHRLNGLGLPLTKMSLMRKYTYDELAALRDSQGPVITVEYEECGRSGELDRKKLVKQYGASVICPASTKTGARLQQYEL
ncbi:hypothetical protein ACC694_21040, partial [Rhizobium ruizarguesonis]